MKCSKKYRNLGSDYFGEQRYVLQEVLEQFCMNDAYLKEWVDELFYMSPPATRKRFTPIPIDASKSWGYSTNSTDNIVRFDDSTETIKVFDFFDESVIDTVKSTTVLSSYTDTSESNVQSVTRRIIIPRNTVKTLHKDTRNYSPWTKRDSNGNIVSDDMTCNEHWYIGYDRARHYETRPNWLINQLHGEIPGITRAQTFKALTSGRLTGITMNLKGMNGPNGTGSPLICEIRRTEKINGVYQPVDSDQPHLAYQEVTFNTSDPGVYTISFEHPPTLQKDETYAVVLLSPLSHISNCYWVGGWSKSCDADLYKDGDAFLSENCGYTWTRYGKKEEVDYHSGQQAPEDFSFQCHIETQEEEYSTNKEYTLYLKPIFSNPVTDVSISAYDQGETAGGDGSIKYYVSNSGKDEEWHEINKTGEYHFDNPKQMTFVKAVLKTTSKTYTPFIESIKVTLKTQKAKTDCYIRTVPYSPRTNGILGANVWSRINTPYYLDNNVKCSTEIILDKEVQERVTIIEPYQVYDYRGLDFNNEFDWDNVKPTSKDSDETKRISADNDRSWAYLYSKKSLLQFLAENMIYVTGYKQTNKDNTTNYIPGFIWNADKTDAENEEDYRMKIHLKGHPASPLIYTSLQPSAKGESTINYGEYYDYDVDYENDDLMFYLGGNDKNYPPVGSMVIRYNPLFISGLNGELLKDANTNEYSNSSVSEMPFKLDYLKQLEELSLEDIEKGYVNLRCAPLDPIKEVILNPETDDSIGEETYLVEDKDYRIDYDTNQLIFLKDNDDYIAELEAGDNIKIVYTPDLEDTSLCIGYRFSRTNTDNYIEIHPNYIEYKT